MTVTVQLNPRQALSFDKLEGSATVTRGALLTIEGKSSGPALNCAVIPLERINDVIASLMLVRDQLRPLT